MKWLALLVVLSSSSFATNGPPDDLPRLFIERSPYRVDVWAEGRRPWQEWQPNFYSLRRIGAASQDTAFFINLTFMSSDSIYFCRVPSPVDSQHVMLTTAQGKQMLFTPSQKSVAPSIDIAMKLELALGQLSDSLNLIEQKHDAYIKIGNRGLALVGAGVLLTGLCVGDLVDKYPNDDFQKKSLRAGIALGSLTTIVGLIETFRYITKRHSVKSMEDRLRVISEEEIGRMMNTQNP